MFLILMNNNLKFNNKKAILEEVSIHKAHHLKENYMKVLIKEGLNPYQTTKVLKIH
jgi:hypothetical protein